MQTRSRGFTLIELLVVIAIIAILAATLFPAFERAKAKSIQLECANNIKQIVTATLRYADDWNNRLPGLNAFGSLIDGRYATSHNKTPDKGQGALWPYLKSKKIYVCPVDLQHRKEYKATNSILDPGGLNYTYTVNSYMTLASESRSNADISGPLMTKSKHPMRTIFIVDENTDPHKGYCTVNDAHFASGDSTCDRHPGKPDVTVPYGPHGTPVGIANVGYLDGHVGAVPGLVCWSSTAGQMLFWK